MININLFRRKSSGCLTRVVHKSSWAKFNKTTTCDTTRGNKHKENTTSSRASTSRMRTAEPLTAEVGAKQSIKRQLYTTHVRAFGWEPHSSSTTTWADKVDHELRTFPAKASPLGASSTQHMWELLAGNRTAVLHDMRGEGGSWVWCLCAPYFNLSFEKK